MDGKRSLLISECSVLLSSERVFTSVLLSRKFYLLIEITFSFLSFFRYRWRRSQTNFGILWHEGRRNSRNEIDQIGWRYGQIQTRNYWFGRSQYQSFCHRLFGRKIETTSLVWRNSRGLGCQTRQGFGWKEFRTSCSRCWKECFSWILCSMVW